MHRHCVWCTGAVFLMHSHCLSHAQALCFSCAGAVCLMHRRCVYLFNVLVVGFAGFVGFASFASFGGPRSRTRENSRKTVCLMHRRCVSDAQALCF